MCCVEARSVCARGTMRCRVYSSEPVRARVPVICHMLQLRFMAMPVINSTPPSLLRTPATKPWGDTRQQKRQME